jgi:1-pyrroline-5-carboxylate dehydrogenase
VWKPSPGAVYSNYIIYQILAEAGLPPGVIQFVPGPAEEVVGQAISHPSFAGLHFTGSTFVFKKLWKDIAKNLDIYKVYPRIVGETGGKNFHLVHQSAEITNAVMQTVRSAFEYQGTASKSSHHAKLTRGFESGQKCSACSRLYVSSSIWESGFKDSLLDEVANIRLGAPQKMTNFMGPVMSVHWPR